MTRSQRLSCLSELPFTATLPGSKSYTNRALVISAQRTGTTEIINGLHSQDTDHLAQCLGSFGGLEVERIATGYTVHRDAGRLQAPRGDLYVGGAGTPARLLIAFACGAAGQTVITGNERLRERPMGHILASLRGAGLAIDELGKPGCLPVRVHGAEAVSSMHWSVDGSVSSQFATSLLIFAAQQRTGPIQLAVENGLVSEPYVRMTVQMLNNCGIRATTVDLRHFTVDPAEPRCSRLEIETDASAMSYFLAAAAITRSTVVIPRIGRDSAQGDVGFAQVLQQMGCRVVLGERQIEITGKPLKGIAVDMKDMPDTVLTLAAVAAVCNGPTTITGIGNLRVKECDRIHAASVALTLLGCRVQEGADSLSISPNGLLRGALIPTFDDHRVAMAFGTLGLAQDDIEIEDPDCVTKSFPQFWAELDRFRQHHRSLAQ